MDTKNFFENFETIANAPGGIARLRSLALTLAMSGQLIQKDNDWIDERLGDCVVLRNGRAYSQSELLDAGTPVIRIQNLNGGNNWYFSDLDLPPEKLCGEGDLLFAWSASFGPYIWNGPKAIFHYHIWKIDVGPQLHRDFLFYLLQHLTEEIKQSSHGLAMLHMTKKKMENLMISFPSTSEQLRIVTKIKEIFLLCDELESAQVHQNSVRTAARKSAIDSISTATTPDDLNAGWKRISNNWTVFADTPESIASLRSLILDLAMRGQLMIAEEKSNHSEVRFIELGSVLTLEYGKPLDKSLRTINGQIPVYGANGIKAMTGQSLVKDRGIVVGRKGSAGEVNMTDGPFWPLDVTFFVKFDGEAFDIQYLYYLLKSLDLPRMARGIKPGINRNDVNKLEVLLVDLAEQKRIVAKADQLMSLCDELERSLGERKVLSQKVLGALVAEVAA